MRNRLILIVAAFTALALGGCGGGGGGAPGPVTKAAAKVYLFGNMTSAANLVNQRIATVNASFAVPTSVLVNYSTAPGVNSGMCVLKAVNPPAGTCILRDTVVTPSGPVQVAKGDLNGTTYDIGTRTLTISLVNSGSALKSSKTANGGKGIEFATATFNLATAGVTPTALSVPLVPTDKTVSIETFNPQPPYTVISVLPVATEMINLGWSYY